eukprot:CAMPEP_0202957212 /NCGR_PEP_ID=MMETSP1396-20130829/1646_1 /ASSEMBLY_ACC=CAM_ASM_000872 /TAXON_ID= /ORGANISM="Pseudokeronopsis sp., Strain Brazil" /LENGTH=70 /DNA_ID=CAMNT_0049674589 /DNA_START=912 /DNA_END=1124 /DNA_ORIENTATION=+
MQIAESYIDENYFGSLGDEESDKIKKRKGTPKNKAKINPVFMGGPQGVPPEYENDPDLYYAIQASMQESN